MLCDPHAHSRGGSSSSSAHLGREAQLGEGLCDELLVREGLARRLLQPLDIKARIASLLEREHRERDA